MASSGSSPIPLPDEYHVLKTVSHVPLAIHALFAGRDQLDDKQVFDLKEYRERIAAAGKVLSAAASAMSS